ncbi:MAG TPA: CoA transferase, partial [Dehalococcoidia bacterium]|nr:CoA transferase [Dehalococcoidia bacterium]
MVRVLEGMKVLDLSSYIAGPMAAMLLADHGAEVVKVERPDGDPARAHAGFLVWNRGKKGITLDLKRPEGRSIARRLALEADVVIENFKPGAAERFGLGYDDLARENPRLVYCS